MHVCMCVRVIVGVCFLLRVRDSLSTTRILDVVGKPKVRFDLCLKEQQSQEPDMLQAKRGNQGVKSGDEGEHRWKQGSIGRA